MRNNRVSIGKRICSLLLSFMLIVSMIPASVFAAGGGSFILVAEGDGKLAIPPTYVSYKDGQTVGAALKDSGYPFVGLEAGWITEINGVVGNYHRSDQDGGYDLAAPASGVKYYRFCEAEESQFTEGLKALMTAMADYQTKAPDVQAAAKAEYDTACKQFVGIDSANAKALADALNSCVKAYEDSQSGTRYPVTFENGNDAHQGAEITVVNDYGKEWRDDGDGTLELPAGNYHFQVSKDGLHVAGDIEVRAAMRVPATLPTDLWLDQDAFRLSGSYNEGEDGDGGMFTDDEYVLDSWNQRNLEVAVKDNFTGKIYSYVKYKDAANLSDPTITAIYQSAKTEKTKEQKLAFESFVSGISEVLSKGAEGNTVTYRISAVGRYNYVFSQDYTVTFHRIPTLTGITVSDEDGTDQASTEAFRGDKTEYTYKILDSVGTVTVKAEPLDDAYDVTINGASAKDGVDIEVNGETQVPVVVSYGDYENTYNLTILPGEGREVSFITETRAITLKVVNANGQIMPYSLHKEGTNQHRYKYVLVPGETYSYVATSHTYYHAADEFTMEDSADTTIRVDVPMDDWMTSLSFRYGVDGGTKTPLALQTEFTAANHAYITQMPDIYHIPYIRLNTVSGVSAKLIYEQKFNSNRYHGEETTKELTSGATTWVQMNRFLMDENPIENTATIRLSKDVDGVTHYQDYIVDFQRQLTLKDISAKCEGKTVTLVSEDGKMNFAPQTKEYNVTVSMAAQALELNLLKYTENRCYGETEVGYHIAVDGADVTEVGVAVVPLNGTLDTQTITVTVENDKAPNGATEYIIHVLKSPPVEAGFDINPENALIAMYETMSGERVWPNKDGKFQLCEGYNYQYAATAYGYVGKTGVLEVTRDENTKNLIVKDGEERHAVTGTPSGGGALTIDWTLAKAETNASIRTDMTAEWDSFRGNPNNNGVTDAEIPTAAEEGTLYWANKIGEGYSADAVGSPILVDGDLVTYAGNKIFRVDTVTGEIKVTGTMDHKSAHATTPPSYAEGMVFVALTDGTVQAFNADTLESLWIYKDPLGGQPVCPLTIHDGYLYTGFWNSETAEANFVCLSITDENPKQSEEAKAASWYHTAAGGYYWAGAYVCDDFVLIGTDDGTSRCDSKTSGMLLFDPVTGKMLDSWKNLNGDIRSSVVYDAATNAYYFTSKGGTFYSMQVVQKGSGWKFANTWSVNLESGADGVPMSTCSPSVYNGRAYVGVSGEGQFAAYSGHNITVLDLKKKSIAYRIETQGYPQTSGLLTTAYEEESGYVYVYFFDNMTPGKLRVLRDKAGQTKADYTTTEGKYTTAYALFTPTGDQAEYAICSPIVDEYGTVYFKNDSAHMMAFGSRITKIQVTKKPSKMIYRDGESFNPEGMVVTATYRNGKTRDVTKYVTYDLTKITEKEKTVTITFPHVQYHNEENGTEMIAGIMSTTPVTTLSFVVGEPAMGDVNFDGAVDTIDAGLVVSHYYEDVILTDDAKAFADVNKDGEVDTEDAGLIVSYYYGTVKSLD
ncbi:MAG: PQQ-binding-like beta-propeller repeat protein [Firmicutes bacterium]|nr:PQQ-binding-like beta-propeller repeat protein [Bacillota bacterium]